MNRILAEIVLRMKYAVMTLLIVVLTVCGANAHEIRPAIVDFKINSGGTFDISIQLNLEAWMAKIGAVHDDTSQSPNATEYDRLRAMDENELLLQFENRSAEWAKSITLSFDGNKVDTAYQNAVTSAVGDVALARDSFVFLSGNVPAGAKQVTWSWALDNGASVFRFAKPGAGEDGEDLMLSTFIGAGQVGKEMAVTGIVKQSWADAFFEYIYVGFDHIIPKGLDHILFVVGLFLLSTRFSALLWQVTAFTIAHTVTLGLGMAGLVSVPASIVEPLIAASIVYVAVENLFMDRLSRWRPVLIFGFGLLHGLGFASVLNEFGLSSGSFVAGLIGFNIGVEVGQLTVIAICFLLVGFWFGKKPWYHRYVTVPGSLVIAIIAAYWFYERVFLG